MALKDMAVNSVCRQATHQCHIVLLSWQLEHSWESTENTHTALMHHATPLPAAPPPDLGLTAVQHSVTRKKAIPTPATPTIHGKRMNRITPRMFCTVGRYTPIMVPRFACREKKVGHEGRGKKVWRERGSH